MLGLNGPVALACPEGMVLTLIFFLLEGIALLLYIKWGSWEVYAWGSHACSVPILVFTQEQLSGTGRERLSLRVVRESTCSSLFCGARGC